MCIYFSVFTLLDRDGNVFTLSDVGIETCEIVLKHLGVFNLLDVDGNVFTLLDVGKETRELICNNSQILLTKTVIPVTIINFISVSFYL